jgi:hypothetical protein
MNLLVVGGVFLAAMSAYAGGKSDDNFKARLSGLREVPAISTTGGGEFRARVNERDQTIRYQLSYDALEGTDTLFAHIHIGQTDVNGGVAAFLCGGGGKPACPDTGGMVEGTITAADVIGPAGQGVAASEFSEMVGMMRSGNAYANVHTNKHPPGEIRGQIKGHGHDDD